MSLIVDGTQRRMFRFEGYERISELYEFIVEIADAEVDLEATLGVPVVLTIAVLDEPRHIHGIVSAAEYTGHSRNQELYRLTISPWAHRMLHRASSRIFQGKTTPEIVREVLLAAGLSTGGFRFALNEAYARTTIVCNTGRPTSPSSAGCSRRTASSISSSTRRPATCG